MTVTNPDACLNCGRTPLVQRGVCAFCRQLAALNVVPAGAGKAAAGTTTTQPPT